MISQHDFAMEPVPGVFANPPSGVAAEGELAALLALLVGDMPGLPTTDLGTAGFVPARPPSRSSDDDEDEDEDDEEDQDENDDNDDDDNDSDDDDEDEDEDEDDEESADDRDYNEDEDEDAPPGRRR